MTSYEWVSRYEQQKAAKARGRAWADRRNQLELGDRAAVAKALGLGERTVQRYETQPEGAPAWYDLALVGLWNYRKSLDGNKKPPDFSEG